MRVIVRPGIARGRIDAPPSKSMSHRMLICAGLAEGTSLIEHLAPSQDVLATVDCLRALGAEVEWNGAGDAVTVKGCDIFHAPEAELNCRESGSTLRFFLPLCLLSESEKRLCGTGRLMERPQEIYRALCEEKGIAFEQSKDAITVRGRLQSGEYHIDGRVSSQFISGLLFALPLLAGDSLIHIENGLESLPYIELTRAALLKSGIQTEWIDCATLKIYGGQTYAPIRGRVEGDFSNAIFFDALRFLGTGSEVFVDGLDMESVQGDSIYPAYLAALTDPLPMEMRILNLKDCPDLAPMLFAIAAANRGGIFEGTARLKWKESDRIAAMKHELAAFGGSLIDEGDRVIVEALPLHAPDRPLLGHNDHRIVMSLAVLLTRYGGTIEGAEAVSKSLPDFFARLASLGIDVTPEEGEPHAG